MQISSRAASAGPEEDLVEVRSPPTCATHLENMTNSLDSLPSSGSDVDEAVSDHVDSTFLDNFERDLCVPGPVVDMTINDDARSHGGVGPVHEFVSIATVVPANAGIGYYGRFAVLAEEDSEDDEVMPEVRACRRRVVASPSFPPTEADPVRPTHRS